VTEYYSIVLNKFAQKLKIRGIGDQHSELAQNFDDSGQHDLQPRREIRV
jgi:hypothetical protein